MKEYTVRIDDDGNKTYVYKFPTIIKFDFSKTSVGFAFEAINRSIMDIEQEMELTSSGELTDEEYDKVNDLISKEFENPITATDEMAIDMLAALLE